TVSFKDVYPYNPAQRAAAAASFGLGGLFGTIVGGSLVQRWMRTKGPQILPVITGIMVVEFGIGMVLMGVMPWALGSIAMLFALAFGYAGFTPAYNSMIGL